MATASTPAPAQAPEPKSKPEQVAPRPSASAPADGAPRPHLRFRKYLTPALVLLLAAALVLTLTRNWNAWEGGRIEQVTDDAYVRSDLTPLSTKVSGIVREVKVSDYQTVAKGDLIVELEHDDYQAQLDQAKAAVEAAKSGIEPAASAAGCKNRSRLIRY
jgi:membrane fusion protein (multidrug efflux system)